MYSTDLPLRHPNHVIDNISQRYLFDSIPPSWILTEWKVDYGTDYNCEIVNDQQVTGSNFSIQLKGKKVCTSSQFISVTLKKSTIRRWLNRLEPTMIIVYVLNEKEGYWRWFESNAVDLTKSQSTFQFKIPRKSKLSEIDWSEIVGRVSTIFSRKHLLYENPVVQPVNKLGWNAFFEGNFSKALSEFEILLQKEKHDAVMLEAMAISEFKLFSYNKALHYINKALLYSNSNGIRLNKASILTELGIINNDFERIREAITIFASLESQKFGGFDLYYNWGSALSKLQKHKESISKYKKALSIDSNRAEAWNNLGNSFMILKQHDLEMMCYEFALNIEPNQAETIFSKGSSLFRYFNKVDEGIALMLKAVSLTSRHEIDQPTVFFWIAEAFMAKKRLFDAEKWNSDGLVYFGTNNYLRKQRIRILSIKGSTVTRI